MVVIDVQTKLIGLIPDRERLVFNIARLLEGAKLLGLPVVGTEQYPQGLGGTVESLKEAVPAWRPKLRFSCAECAEMFQELRDGGRDKLLLVGMETHVCVQQTALDLVGFGFDVFVAVDAVAARHAIDHETALRRMAARMARARGIEVLEHDSAVAPVRTGDATNALLQRLATSSAG